MGGEAVGGVANDFLDGDWIESKDQSDSGIRLVQTGNIGVGKFISKPDKARYISEETFKKLRCTEIYPGDCLISRLPDPAGRACLLPDIGERMITAVDCTIVRFNKDEIIPYFFILLSQTKAYLLEAESHGSGSTRKRISRDNLSKIKLPLPSLPEQQKITDCLSSLDQVIELQAKTLEALKAHKKGLMQQLFPREGETVPRLRFPEFRNAGPWEVKRLGEVCEITMGASPKSSAYNVQKIGLPLLQGNADIKESLSSPRIFTSEITKECFPDDILLSVRAPVGTVAKSIHHACIGRGIAALRSMENNSQEFLYQFLLLHESNWSHLSQGGTFDSINSSDIKKLKVVFPSISEQQKIADSLSSLDEVIELQTKKLEALKTHKKGLMQQLFPQEVG